VLPLQTVASRVLADIIRRQPPSHARTNFAWSVVVGPAIARATAVSLEDGTLRVFPRDVRWTPELMRARGVILSRLQALLGPDAVRELRIEG
jgi:predicted nucleic acid-binding Zn ribbon protein